MKKTDKSLSTGKKLLVIMLLSCSLVMLGVSVGFAYLNIYSLFFAAPSGILAFVMLLILLKDYKPASKEKTTKWFVDKYLVALVTVWIISAIILIAVGCNKNETVMYAGFLVLPLISILVAPNAALYALRDMKDWEKIFYDKGNLGEIKDNKDFYSIKAPVTFENRLFLAVVKDQILNIFTVISVMVVGAIAGLIAILIYDSLSVSPGDLFGAIVYVKLRQRTGLMAFILLLVVVFGFPIFVYYVTNVIYKLRIVAGHKYMAYHAIVNSMNNGQIKIDRDKRKYNSKYCTLVGMREKEVNNTPAVLIFIPDDVFVFPDGNED
jgi:hypothetical protein